MPVINTRKRKPSAAALAAAAAAAAATPTPSSLDRLLSVSAHELRSNTLNDNASDDSDAASSYSGDFPLRRMRRTARPGRHRPPHQDAYHGKRRRVDASDLSDDDDDDESPYKTPSGHRDEWCAPRLREEILQLQATVETMLGRNLVDAPASPLEAVQAVHAAMRGLQSLLSERVSAELLERHAGATLEDLWARARQAADHEMRAKLTFWKHKAQQLRETLRTSIDANANATAQTPTATLQDALDFVSTFYLLDMTPEDAHIQDPIKAMAITMATGEIVRQLQRLEAQRLREMPLVQPLANSLLLLSQRPPPRPTVGTYGDAQDESSRATTIAALGEGVGTSVLEQAHDRSTATDENMYGHWAASRLDRSSHEVERSRSTLPPHHAVYRPALPSRVNSARASAASSTVSTPRFSSATSTPSATSATHATNARSRVPTPAATTSSISAQIIRDAIPQISTKALTVEARRRLSSLVESQLQTKTQASPASRSPATQQPLPWTNSTTPTPAVNIPSSNRGAAAATHSGQQLHQRVASAARAPSLVSSSNLSGSATTGASPPPQPAADDGSDSDISHSGLGCATCGRNDSYSSLLLCDNGCEREFHTFCLQPPLDKIPEGDWYCPKCLAMENIQPDSRVYSCSAAQCNKITGAKYCSLHRCKFDMCVNRSNAGGFCRRHERFKEPKVARRSGGLTESSTPKVAATSTPLLPATSAPRPTPVARPPTVAATAAPKVRLDTEQLMNSMRQMGIWLPANMMGSAAAPKPPATPSTTLDVSSAVV